MDQAITYTDGNTKARHAHYKHFHRFNFDCLTKVKEGICPPRGSTIAKRAEVMQSQGKTRHQLITLASFNLRITHSTKASAEVVTASLLLRREMKETKPNKGKGQKQGWGNAVARVDREADEESNT